MGSLAVLLAVCTTGCAHDRSRVAGYHGSIKDSDPYAAAAPAAPAPHVHRKVEHAAPMRVAAAPSPASQSGPARPATEAPPVEPRKPESERQQAAKSPVEPAAAAPPAPDNRGVRNRIRPKDTAAATPAVTPAAPAPAGKSAQPAPPVTTAAAAIAASEQLLDQGRVLAARETLLRAFDATKPDVVAAFARTFDPLHIARSPNADAKPDVQAAIALYADAERLGAVGATDALQRLRATKPN